MTYGDFHEAESKKILNSRRSKEWYDNFYERLKRDPVRYAAFLKRRRETERKRYEAIKADPARYAAYLERAQKHKRTRLQKEKRPRTPNNHVPIKALPVEERRVYYKKRTIRILAREHARDKKLDLYTVYKEWDLLLARDYPGMSNPAATKAAHTKPTRETKK